VRVNLGLHDFSILNNHLDTLERLREYYPSLKVSMFTIPNDLRYEREGEERRSALERVKSSLDWIELIPHGLYHNSAETAGWEYGQFKNEIIPTIKSRFDKDGLPFVKGFCAPHWKWSKDVVDALDELGWWGAIDPRQNMPRTRRFFAFSHSIETPFYEDDGDYKLYGHVNGTSANDLDRCFDNLLRIPRDAQWCFASEFVEEE
jgi:hypothetical protein